MAQISTVDALAQTAFLIQRALEQRADEHGFSLTQTRLLGVLRDREPTMNELAQLLDIDKSSASGLVDRAERRGLVQRTPSTLDRRSVLVRLTTQGRRLVDEVSARFEQDVTAMLEPLTASEHSSLTALLSRVIVAHAAAHGVDLLATAPGA